jgi:ATP-binding cassette subfamily B protein
MLLQHKLLVVVSFVGILAGEFLPQFQPKILMDMIDGPIAQGELHRLWPYGAWFLAIVMVSSALRYISTVASQTLALRIIHSLRQELFQKVQSYHIDFFKRTPVGRLMTRLTNDIDSLNAMFSSGFVELAGSFLLLIFPIFFMLYLDWRLALVSLVCIPFMTYFTSLFRVKVRNINTHIRKSIAELNTRMQESLSGNHIVQIFGKSQEQFKAFDQINFKLQNQWFKNVLYHAIYFPFVAGLTEIGLSIMYFFGAYLFLQDAVSLGTLVAFSWYMGMFWRPLREIGEKFTQLQGALSAAERVFTLVDLDASLPQGTHREWKPGDKQVVFKDVSFGYTPDSPVLKNISFSVNKGETLAIVGATGSGKSTLISLCNRFYIPDSGSIYLGDQPIEAYSLGVLSKQVAFIPQDVYLFAETIAFNIALSDNVDMDKLERVCRYANAHHFVASLPNQYQTRLTERGQNLSTGQRQLLAIARALYQEPDILLLDEATSSIDTETEALVQNALEKLTQQVTTIVVAHRLSTIRSAHQILVMHKGEIQEQGNHQELLAQNGLYKKLYELQDIENQGVG